MKTETQLAKVRKRNDLIQKSRFSLSTQQQKIVLFLISKIKPTDTEFHEYQFSIKDFCEACNINSTGGTVYDEIKASIKDIADKSLWVTLDDGSETLLRWIDKAKLNQGTITIRLDNDMKPYLLQLNKNYTTFDLVYALSFKSKYTIRLYELIKSIHYDEAKPYSKAFSIEELKKLLGAETYKTYAEFKKRALDPAINEINSTTEKSICYEIAEKSGKKIISLILKIDRTDPIKQLITYKTITEECKK